MKLTKQEQEAVMSMRLAEQSSKSKEVDQYKSVRGNYHSALDAQLVSALRSPIEAVSHEAKLIYKGLKDMGYNSIAEAPELSIAQYSQLNMMIKEGVKLDSTNLSYDLVAETATQYDRGYTDEELASDTKATMDSMRNSDTSPDERQITNPQTGKQYMVDKLGKTREYNPEQDYQNTLTESEINFANYVSQGGNPSDFGFSLNGDESLTNV